MSGKYNLLCGTSYRLSHIPSCEYVLYLLYVTNNTKALTNEAEVGKGTVEWERIKNKEEGNNEE